MSSDQPGRRRASPAVYRRRRIVLAVVVVLLIGMIWLLIAQPWRGAASEPSGQTEPPPSSSAPTDTAATDLPAPGVQTPTPTSAATSTPAPSKTPVPSPSPSSTKASSAKACMASDLLVEAVTDQDTYAAGQNPKLSIRLTNQGTKDCSLNVGTTTQKFTITSGSDTWWRSTDCQTTPSDALVLLAAGQTVSSVTPLTWDRTRSSVKTCSDANRPKAPGGGASYHLSVSIGGVDSTDTKQFLLY